MAFHAKLLADHLHPDDRELAAQTAAQSFASGKGGINRFRWRTKNGGAIWVEAQSIVVRDDAGHPRGMRGVTMDITPAVEAEQERTALLGRERVARAEAEEASRLRDEFLATVSHELRTPLNAVVGWARLLRTGQVEPKEVDHALEVIERNAYSQKRIIEDMLEVSRVITGKLRLQLLPLDLLSVVQGAIDVVRPGAEAKEIKIVTEFGSSRLIVSGDAERLQQVVWNLLANAVKFTPFGGSVEIQANALDSHIELVVADTGPGIDLEFLPRVFERFSQADGSSTRQFGGLGLGLAIVRHLVELHGGTVEAGNRTDKDGAVFKVTLPGTLND